MGVDSFYVCRTCKKVLMLGKYLHYQFWQTPSPGYVPEYAKIWNRRDALAQSFRELHSGHDIHLVDEHSEIMEECHHGWEYEFPLWRWDEGNQEGAEEISAGE